VIAGVVLAAGGSSRLGSPKQLVRVEERSLVVRAVESCLGGGCSRVSVVLGASAERIRPALRGRPVEVLVNDDWRSGIASSIRTAISALPDEAEGVVLAVCDQPRLSSDVVRRLIAAFDGAPERMVACEYAGTVGVPAVFGRGRFEELLQLRGDSGARQLLRKNLGTVVRLAWPDGALDLDLPADLGEI